ALSSTACARAPTDASRSGLAAADQLGVDLLGLAELSERVDAEQLAIVGAAPGVGGPPFLEQQPHGVGEVVLALRIPRGEPPEHGREVPILEGVGARVDLVHAALLVGGVALLDDARDAALGVAHDPAVT